MAGIVQPDEAARVDAEAMVAAEQDQEVGDVEHDELAEAAAELLASLPLKAADFLRNNASLAAQKDVAACLTKNGVTNGILLQDLDKSVCKTLARDLTDEANLVVLRALARIYALTKSDGERAPKRKRDEQLEDFDEEVLLLRQRQFQEKYGTRVAGRFVVKPATLAKMRVRRMVPLSACDGASIVTRTGSTHTFLLDKTTGTSRLGDEDHKPSDDATCQAADFFLRLSRWGLSACLLGQMTPTEVLLYTARIAELGRCTGVSCMQAADAEVRAELSM
ncbi:hypothetical protein Pmar_PMAR001336, partial [Perkinsus marinus ATCC 50983]